MSTITAHFSFMLKPSSISGAGVGVFAVHDIAAGTPLALFSKDLVEVECDPSEVPAALQMFCLDLPGGKLQCPTEFNRLDIGNYINHSANSNVAWSDEEGHVARRNLKAGEELLADYRELGEPEESWEDYYTES